MKKATTLVIILLLATPSLVLADSMIFRIGYFMPKALNNLTEDSLWGIEFDQMNFRKNDFRAAMYGFGYEYFLTKEFSLALTVDFYSRTKGAYYYDWIGYSLDEGDFAFPADIYQGDFLVGHNFAVSITPLQLSVKLAPIGRRNRFVPYVGGGVGLYFWRAVIRGEIVDFSDPWIYPDPDLGDIDIYPVVFTDVRETGRVTLGYHAFGGIQIPIGYRLTLDAEARYNIARGKWKTDSAFLDFTDFELGGLVLSAGFSYWF